VIRRPPSSIATARTSPRAGPFPVQVEADQQYLWCSCGRSASQPWCDGSHAGTGFEPIEFVPPLAAIFHMCGCKRSQNKPYCFGNCRGLMREARLAKEGE
jgi:CDGSH-type Zn-finger protein